jgi:hypothetical protein
MHVTWAREYWEQLHYISSQLPQKFINMAICISLIRSSAARALGFEFQPEYVPMTAFLVSLLSCMRYRAWWGQASYVILPNITLCRISGSHSSVYEEFYLLGCITPCSRLKVDWRFRGTCLLRLHGRRISQERNQRGCSYQGAFTLVSYFAYTSTLKMEKTCSSETPVDYQRTT